jgi:tetratricopeptide (TPR) repeat protein
MRLITVILLLFVNNVFVKANEAYEQEVNHISSLIDSYPDSALNLALQFKVDSEKMDNDYGIVQSNYILAYIYDDVFQDYGKSIIYYLEAIRHAENSNYPNVSNDLISLYKNSGVIFRKFKTYDLAIKYYQEGLNLANEHNNKKQLLSISYNLSGIYMDMKQYSYAEELITNSLINLEIGSIKYLELMNRLSVVYYESGSFKNAIAIQKKIVNLTLESRLSIHGYSLHNLAESYKMLNILDSASYFYKEAIAFKEANEPSSLFSSYVGYAETLTILDKLNLANSFYEKALVLMPNNPRPEDFDMLKSYADLHFQLGNYSKFKMYNDNYSEYLNSYLRLQEELQETDKRYNMDLITKRYFDEVDKQEKIASILFYSRLTSGSLLILLLAVIGYNRYEKLRVRKSIEQQLLRFEVIE